MVHDDTPHTHSYICTKVTTCTCSSIFLIAMISFFVFNQKVFWYMVIKIANSASSQVVCTLSKATNNPITSTLTLIDVHPNQKNFSTYGNTYLFISDLPKWQYSYATSYRSSYQGAHVITSCNYPCISTSIFFFNSHFHDHDSCFIGCSCCTCIYTLRHGEDVFVEETREAVISCTQRNSTTFSSLLSMTISCTCSGPSHSSPNHPMSKLVF